jgi:hypothetical protein
MRCAPKYQLRKRYMSMFSWLFPSSKPAPVPEESSGLSRMESTRPVIRHSPKEIGNNAQPANRKSERMERRELLYSIVREAMVHAGVLTASYKFKVLSLDARGRQFLVMVDLARNNGEQIGRLAEIEAMIAQGAKSRHDIVVTAVYWRTNEHVAVGDPANRAQQRASAPLEPQPAQPQSNPSNAQTASPPPAAGRRALSHHDPIQSDEVTAFKRALAAGVADPAAAAAAEVGISKGSDKHGPQNYTLLTGFEDTEFGFGDTEIMQDTAPRMPTLSGTQFGDLN